MKGDRHMHQLRTIAAAGIAVASVMSLAPAQTITAEWLNPVSGNWTDATKWSTNPNYPQNGTPAGSSYQAIIDALGQAYTVTVDSAITVGSLTLDSADATLYIRSGMLRVSGGTLQIASGVTVRGEGANGYGTIAYVNGDVINAGTVRAEDGTMFFVAATATDVFVNDGLIEATTGAVLNAEGRIDNTAGIIR